MNKKWSREDIVRIFEILMERGCGLFSHPELRKLLNRDENLVANQLTREANGNIAYRTVDFDLSDELSDDAFWEKIAQTPYRELIEENAAVGIIKMAEKLKLFEK